MAVRIMPGQFNQMDELRNRDIQFFFDEAAMPCYSLPLLDAMVTWGISDIYIYDNLCYNMEEVKKKCEENNIHTRLIINSIPSISPNKNNDVKAPIYCPRDADIIAKYIDILEFDCWNDNIYNWHLFNVLYKTWIKRKD